MAKKKKEEFKKEEPIIIYCAHCGSTNVSRDATAKWNVLGQYWELADVFDHADCEDCGGETRLREAPITGMQNKS